MIDLKSIARKIFNVPEQNKNEVDQTVKRFLSTVEDMNVSRKAAVTITTRKH